LFRTWHWLLLVFRRVLHMSTLCNTHALVVTSVKKTQNVCFHWNFDGLFATGSLLSFREDTFGKAMLGVTCPMQLD